MAGTRLSAERLGTLTQIAELDVVPHLLRSGASELDRTAVWSALAAIAAENADRAGAAAVEAGHSYAEASRALGITRQAVRKCYGPSSPQLSSAAGVDG